MILPNHFISLTLSTLLYMLYYENTLSTLYVILERAKCITNPLSLRFFSFNLIDS